MMCCTATPVFPVVTHIYLELQLSCWLLNVANRLRCHQNNHRLSFTQIYL
jgi:hypothetical protein